MKTLTAQQIAEVVKILKPLSKARVSQKFGPSPFKEQQGWYSSFGWLGHNGIDFGVPTGTKCMAVTQGKIIDCYTSPSAGTVLSYDTGWYTKDDVVFKLRFYYFHLKENLVKASQAIDAGQVICITNNSGYYTTGAHLHFGVVPIYLIDGVKEQKDYSNGYDGAIDPEPLFSDTNYQNFAVEKFYGKKRNWILEYTFRFANSPVGVLVTPFLSERIKAGRYIQKRLIAEGRKPAMLTDNETNAIIYGAWDLDTVLSPAMFPIWARYTKAEYEAAKANGSLNTNDWS